jgi:hypothetical protein
MRPPVARSSGAGERRRGSSGNAIIAGDAPRAAAIAAAAAAAWCAPGLRRPGGCGAGPCAGARRPPPPLPGGSRGADAGGRAVGDAPPRLLGEEGGPERKSKTHGRGRDRAFSAPTMAARAGPVMHGAGRASSGNLPPPPPPKSPHERVSRASRAACPCRQPARGTHDTAGERRRGGNLRESLASGAPPARVRAAASRSRAPSSAAAAE